MNKLFHLTVFLLILSILGCVTSTSSGGGQQSSQNLQEVEGVSQQAAAIPPPAAAFWTGDGGEGKSITILAPKTSGLEENQNYLPDLVQGELVSNFNDFSAIEVLDRVSLDDQYTELLSGYYEEDAAELNDLGHLAPTDYLMGGNITKTAAGYVLQITVTRNADKMTAATYSGSFNFTELDNLSGIRKASLDLLQKLGVAPTEQTRTELAGAATVIHVNAQTALARGINAQREGTEVAAYSYFNMAASLDPSMLEAANRSSIIAANITGSNIGENARNDIAWRRQWVERLTETEEFFADLFTGNSVPYTLFYSTEIIPGDINYQTETQTLSINTNLRPVGTWAWLASVERTLKDVYDGLDATKRKYDWGLENWPGRGVTDLRPFEQKYKQFTIVAELVNSDDKVIGRTEFNTQGSWAFNNIRISVSNDDRKQVRFENVKAEDMTDSLTIRIVSVNGMDAASASQTGVLQIKAITKRDWDLYTLFTMEKDTITRYNGNFYSLLIPALWNEPAITIAKGVFWSKGLTSVRISGDVSVIIGDEAFIDNRISTIIIETNSTTIGKRAFFDMAPESKYRFGQEFKLGDGVITIGDEAFSGNRISSVWLPDSVRSIGAKAFYNTNSDDNGNSVPRPGGGRIIHYDSTEITEIRIGADVEIGDLAFGYRVRYNDLNYKDHDEPRDGGFRKFYIENGRRAGTYTAKEERNINRRASNIRTGRDLEWTYTP